jgi:hypothetical protein
MNALDFKPDHLEETLYNQRLEAKNVILEKKNAVLTECLREFIGIYEEHYKDIDNRDHFETYIKSSRAIGYTPLNKIECFDEERRRLS